MKNILSYNPGAKFKGKEIKDWIKFHIENQTEYTKEANKMIKYLNISDNVEYQINRGYYQASKRQYCVFKENSNEN